MTDKEFSVAMEWMMCSDPFPLCEDKHKVLWEMLDREAQDRGYDDWIQAYHEV